MINTGPTGGTTGSMLEKSTRKRGPSTPSAKRPGKASFPMDSHQECAAGSAVSAAADVCIWSVQTKPTRPHPPCFDELNSVLYSAALKSWVPDCRDHRRQHHSLTTAVTSAPTSRGKLIATPSRQRLPPSLRSALAPARNWSRASSSRSLTMSAGPTTCSGSVSWPARVPTALTSASVRRRVVAGRLICRTRSRLRR